MDSITTGTVFQDRYEVLSKIGEGGFGQVYRARQRTTHHEVAIKVLRALHTTNDTHIARFQREMQLCAQLYHPNIVRLVDSGRVEPDLLYTVFEYVPGKTLTDVLVAEGALPPPEAAQLMLQVLDALACAHKKDVIHRDLKPQNIMVTTTGARRNAMVLDFGLGTLPSEQQEELAKITRTREVLGTPTYAAPEQLRGEPVSPSSDLYSWGLIFLECLTGRRAVDGATLQQVIYKQLGPEPVVIPDWLERHRLGRLLRKVTNKNPEQRILKAELVMRELEACTAEGWPVDEAGPRAPTPAQLAVLDTLPSTREGERRQLTALCCSLRFSNGEGQALDEEDLDRLLRSLYSSCAETARRYDAHVGSVLGEWMLFYFGYPRAQEDDARRAARAALEMAARMEKRGAELAREHNGRLDFRVGIHTGLVISQEPRAGGYGGLPSLMGITPNHAVRLEARAEPGTILMSEGTSKLLRSYFALEPVRTGANASAEPVFRLLHEYRGSHALTSQEGQLYGRAQELDFLEQRWMQAGAGTGQSLLLTGEPGIGKSRLVQELIRHARSKPHTFLECRCVPEGRNSALSPMVDLLERLLGLSREWTPVQTVSALEGLLSQYGFVLSEVMPLFLALLNIKGGEDRYPPLGVAPNRAKELTLDALVSLFFEMAQQQPLLLLVEDLHWSDPTTLELLAMIVKDVSSASICLVLTARPEFSAPWSTAHHLQLSRLDRKRVEEMVNGLTQDKHLPREVLDQLVNRTDGVPLFVEELTRVVAESLPQQGEHPSLSWTPTRLAIPTTLRDSLMARLDRLGTAKEVAQLASALGREFSYEVLKAISERDEAELQQELKVLVDADLVHRRRGVRNPTYLFKHALIRDTAYESMLRPLRRQVHARIAATLEAHFPELVETRPELLAMHHSDAGQKREAITYAQKAGMSALVRSANAECVAYITEALSWLDSVEDERERAQIELGLNGILTPASMATRGWANERVKSLMERSQQLIDFLGDSPQTVPTLWGLWLYHFSGCHHEQAWIQARRVMAMAEKSADTSLKVMALCMLGNSALTEDRLDETRDYFEQMLALYDPAQHAKMASLLGLDFRATASQCLCLVKWLQGYAGQAQAIIEAGHRWAEESRHAGSQGLMYLYHLPLLQGRGDREKTRVMAETALELARRFGLVTQTMYFQMYHAWALRDVEALRTALAIPDSVGQDLGRSYYRALLVELLWELGRHEESLQLAEEMIRWGQSTGETYSISLLLRFKGLNQQARGEREAAEASLREAIEVARQQGAKMLELKASLSLFQLLQERGQAAAVRPQLAELVSWFTEGLDLPDLIQARALLTALPA
ncbi:TOMM system kinase/cyclase fusion protein [Hyalangium versicolor]|uniref:TOMM system kinase/cyclase fusion protein n=1 Tax=Hyalangium versicolor TaxID=2861190 RepID=UPI001CCFCFC5|nr:TOMM system kinase/cyclase fusion protein [Hyalangium versicolor]